VPALKTTASAGVADHPADRYLNNHMAFGFGTHFFLGNELARLELSMIQERPLQRFLTCDWLQNNH